MNPPNGSNTADGYELQFGTNGISVPPFLALQIRLTDHYIFTVLGHFVFTIAVLPVLLKTAKELKSQGGFVRVINTSSSMHMMAPAEGIVFDDM